MLTKKQYDYTTGDLNGITPSETTTFTYADSGWKDQLVAVNGTALTYDESGNLRTYGDTTYSWSHGTRLESITDGEKEYGYVYDESGTRFSKTVNGETTQFYYASGLLLAQKSGEDVIFFQYGAGGVPLGFVYNGEQYFYITNQLGDVVGIADSQGEMFVYYTYDEWGNPLETLTRYGTEEEQEIAGINPLRYRGYYYDSETGYYYLQSRYYNPEWGRFISPDSFSYIDNSTRIGFNAYVYCINSPLMYVDPSGNYTTNNWFEAALYVMCIGIEISSFTSAFENVIIKLKPSFNFNNWYNSLNIDLKGFVQQVTLFFTTGFNHFFEGLFDLLFQQGFKNVLDIIDNIDISKGISSIFELAETFKIKDIIKFKDFSSVFDLFKIGDWFDLISSLSSVVIDIIDGVYTGIQPIIIAISETLTSIIDVMKLPGAYSVIAEIANELIKITFKFINHDYL